MKNTLEVPESLISELVGHAIEGMTLGRYGKDYKIEIKLEAIKKLQYGIDMSRLKFPF